MPNPDRTPREIIDQHTACGTAPNGTGMQCTCLEPCVNWWLRAAGYKVDDQSWDRVHNHPVNVEDVGGAVSLYLREDCPRCQQISTRIRTGLS